MNDLLQKHGCANVFNVPEGLKELMSDITREVLRKQPEKIFDFIANYLSVLLITREHGIMAAKILDDLCDCQLSVMEHLVRLGVEHDQADMMAQIINEEIAGLEPVAGKEKLREFTIVKKILANVKLDEEMTAQVCQVIRNTYRDYWYRKKSLRESIKVVPTEPWELAAEHTLELYKKTKPSFDELSRATLKIQAAYRGYYVRRNVLRQFKQPKKVKTGPKLELPGQPRDVGGSREIDLGRVIDLKTQEEDVGGLFNAETVKKLGLKLNPENIITDVESRELVVTGSGTPTKSHDGKIAADSDVTSTPAKKKQQFGGFATGTKDNTRVMRTEIESVYRPIQQPETIYDIEEEKVQRKPSIRGLSSRAMIQEGFVPIISFSGVPPEVFMVDDHIDDIEQILSEPEVEAPLPFADLRDTLEEVTEDIADDNVDDTVPTASSVNSSNLEDIISDVGEEEFEL